MPKFKLSWVLLPLFAMAPLAGCDGKLVSERPDEPVLPQVEENPEFPFDATPVASYAAKVKTLVNGAAVTAEELATLQADPEALPGMVDAWLETPEADAKLLTFFGNTFQQIQFINDDMIDQTGSGLRGTQPNRDRLLGQIKESMSRTALWMAKQGRPMTETLTTRTYMMTPPLMALYAYIDSRQINDRGQVKQPAYYATNFKFALRDSSRPVIPLEQSVNSGHANYMVFSSATATPTTCVTAAAAPVDPVAIPAFDATERLFPKPPADPTNFPSGNVAADLWSFLLGQIEQDGRDGTNCRSYGGSSPFTEEDWNNWKPVTVRTPSSINERPTRFFDIPHFRTKSELVLNTDRVGFFTTPAFFANWRTNDSNALRVTTNQALIVALGKSFDPGDSVIPLSESGLDQAHATEPACYACHKSLDPMRQFFKRNYTLNYSKRDLTVDKTPEFTAGGSFAFAGITRNGETIDDLAKTFATHPLYPTAWVQKLCYYADSQACSEDDPEFKRVASVFQASQFNFKVLVRELFSSPLVTGAKLTKTFRDRPVVVSISRADHLCQALTVRLGVDACDLNATTRSLAQNVPADSYSRGADEPVLSSDATLFFRSATENLCRLTADAVVDTTNGKYKSAAKDAALVDMVTNLMGLPDTDARHAPALAILQEHFAEAVALKTSAKDSLKSTFTLACSSPTVVSVGL